MRLILLALFFITFSISAKADDTTKQKTTQLPSVNVKRLDGTSVNIQEYAKTGKITVISFWATWCGPCISTFPRLRSWHKKYGDGDFVLIGVTQYYGQQSGKPVTPLQELDVLSEFKQKHKLPYAIAVVGPNEWNMKYGIRGIPATVLLDRNGVVRYIGIGSGAEEASNLEEMIEKVLKEETPIAEAKR